MSIACPSEERARCGQARPAPSRDLIGRVPELEGSPVEEELQHTPRIGFVHDQLELGLEPLAGERRIAADPDREREGACKSSIGTKAEPRRIADGPPDEGGLLDD